MKTMSDHVNEISSKRFARAPDELVVLHSTIKRHPPPLKPAESSLAFGVSPFRNRQLATGRNLARKAIQLLGGDPETVVIADPRGIPVWPQGMTGSISHTKSDCVVVAASQSIATSVGIDLETNQANFSRQEWDLVSSEAERNDSANCELLSEDEYVTLIFSAKEAVYKCLSQLAEIELDFQDVDCRLRSDSRGFNTRLLLNNPHAVFPSAIPVDWTVLDGCVLTLAWLPSVNQTPDTRIFSEQISRSSVT